MKKSSYLVMFAPMLAIGSIAWQAAHGEAESGNRALAYLARCALAADQHIEADGERLAGGLGLAASFGQRELGITEQRAVSGCLMALTNAAGQHIEVSLRSQRHEAPAIDEQLAFSVPEGAYFGNVFSQPSQMFVCGGSDAALIAEGRLCAVADAPGASTACGFTYVGACADVCTNRDETGAYRSCEANGTRYDEPMTVFTRPRAAFALETPQSLPLPAPAIPDARDASLATSPASVPESPHDVAPSSPGRETAPAARP
jgi:hypothetical protein